LTREPCPHLARSRVGRGPWTCDDCGANLSHLPGLSGDEPRRTRALAWGWEHPGLVSVASIAAGFALVMLGWAISR
jgi:hypothetical protein